MDEMIEDRLKEIRSRIAAACARSGRAAESVRVIAVTKSVDPEKIRSVIAAGARDLGENRLQEALPKIAALEVLTPVWHFIGRIQRNKVRRIVEAFDWIHSAPNPAIVDEIDEAAVRCGKLPEVLIQVNAAGDSTKAGLTLDGARAYFDSGGFRRLGRIRLAGLMGIAPQSLDEKVLRNFFSSMRECRDFCQRCCPTVRELSMGMSQDYLYAVEEGATMIRVGTALFGERMER